MNGTARRLSCCPSPLPLAYHHVPVGKAAPRVPPTTERFVLVCTSAQVCTRQFTYLGWQLTSVSGQPSATVMLSFVTASTRMSPRLVHTILLRSVQILWTVSCFRLCWIFDTILRITVARDQEIDITAQLNLGIRLLQAQSHVYVYL